jgi:molybdopterin-guanine dinucleotide biosynthesis protein A
MTAAPQPARRPVAGIVLAGGRASRFGRDKLAEPVDGHPLLHHALEALASLVEEIVLVVQPDGEPPALPVLPAGVRLRLVRDPEPFGGPLVALGAALETVHQPYALFAGGDMPSLQPGVLAMMLDALDERQADVVVLEGPGPMQTIPAAIRVDTARTAARLGIGEGSRALRALYDRVLVVALPEAAWRALDPSGATLRDIDTPGDLPGSDA